MKKIANWIAGHGVWFNSGVIAISVALTLLGGLFSLGLFAMVMAFCFFISGIVGVKFTPADREYYEMPANLLRQAVDDVEQAMVDAGYSRRDYDLDLNDCDDYTDAWKVFLHNHPAIKEHRLSVDKADPFFPFSFKRDDGPRHRVLMVLTDEGRMYVENYRIGETLFRELSLREENNGHVPS